MPVSEDRQYQRQKTVLKGRCWARNRLPNASVRRSQIANHSGSLSDKLSIRNDTAESARIRIVRIRKALGAMQSMA